MLGYSVGTVIKANRLNQIRSSHGFGASTGEKPLDNVACTDSEQSLFDYKHAVKDYFHSKDVGVRSYL